MIKKISILILGILLLMVSMNGFCQEDEEFSLRVGVIPLVEHLPLLIAQRDMNAVSKTKVKLDIYTSWTGIEAAFRTGAIDAAAMTLPKALLMAYESVDLKILLVINRNGDAVVLKGGDAPENIKGKIFGGSGSDTMDLVIFSRYLKTKQLQLGPEVRSLLVPLGKAITLVKEDRLYGYCLPEPYGVLGEKEGIAKKIILSKDIFPRHINSVLIVNPSVLKAHPDVIKAYIKAIIKAAAYIEKDKTASGGKQSAMIQVGIYKINPDLVAKALTTPRDRILFEDLTPSQKEIEDVLQDLLGLGVLGGKVNLKEIVDTKYIE